MNYTQFQKKMSDYPVFTKQEIEKHFPEFDTRRLVEWQEKGYILKIRNRYYCFSEAFISEEFLYYTANTIYQPSYVSLESALAYYGIIPEGVFQTVSCTTLKTETFGTPVGHFQYRHIKKKLFFGYTLETWKNVRYAMAELEKAVIDYLYLHSEILDSSTFQSLRWKMDVIRTNMSLEKLKVYGNYLDHDALDKRLGIFKGVLHAET
ncbi:MAG: hypothetical protein U5R06_12405 [candidate division KSB1 bacterium]|nr:hypothetical protein [candidate division KSB1 bacterium]